MSTHCQIYDQGYVAGQAAPEDISLDLQANPYPFGSNEAAEWERGYADATNKKIPLHFQPTTEENMTDRERLVLKAALSFAYSNTSEINDAFADEDEDNENVQVNVGGVLGDSFDEEEFYRLAQKLLLW